MATAVTRVWDILDDLRVGKHNMTLTNVKAAGANTVEWLAQAVTTIAVPIYQRHYRWDVDRCARLLKDIRAVADADNRQTHFIGSILATGDAGVGTALTLIDGQQRITTLTLLAAALHNTVKASAPALAAELRQLLVHPNREGETKLLPHKGLERDLAGIIFDRRGPQRVPGESPFEDNYEFFLREVSSDSERIWRGLRRLEHVSISLLEDANPQQVFESLNSTGAPLKNHELVHNYVLMGLSHAEQAKLEEAYWAPIEQNTGQQIEAFLRDYLIQRTGRDSEFAGEHGVYRVFKTEFPRLTADSLTRDADEWRALSEVYRILLTPVEAGDTHITAQLGYVNVFGSAMYPLVMAVYRDYQRNVIGRDVLLDTLERLQSLFLRKMVVGESRDHLVAQLCRRLKKSGYPIREIVRRTPSNGRVRNALKYRALPHAGYVLQRLDGTASLEGLEIEHIFPQNPTDIWSGDGQRDWARLTEEERARHRALLQTLGNLALLEQPLNAGASNRPFQEKKKYYLQSKVGSTKALADAVTTPDGETPSAWDVHALQARTEAMTEKFLQIWQRPDSSDIEDSEALVPILDAPKKSGWYPGWKTEFEYVKFLDETWEVRDVKTLFNHVFKRLWSTHRPAVLDYSASKNEPIFETKAWESQWDALMDSHYLFMGYIPQYMLGHVQGVLDELGLADEVFVKYSRDESDVSETAAGVGDLI